MRVASMTVIMVMAVVMTVADAVRMGAMAMVVAVGVLAHRPYCTQSAGAMQRQNGLITQFDTSGSRID